MRIDITDAESEQRLAFDESMHFAVRRDSRLWQFIERAQDKFALLQLAERDFADHVWVGKHSPSIEKTHKRIVAAAKMIDPDGRIDENHGRRRGGALSCGCEP